MNSKLLQYLPSVQFEVPSKFQRIIIGQRGQNLRRIESKTGVFSIRILPGPNEVCVLALRFASLAE